MVDGTGNVLLADAPEGSFQAQVTSFRVPTRPPGGDHCPSPTSQRQPTGSERSVPTAGIPALGSPCREHLPWAVPALLRVRGWARGRLSCRPRPGPDYPLPPSVPPSVPLRCQRRERARLFWERRALSGFSLWERHQNSRRKEKKWKLSLAVGALQGGGQLRPGRGTVEALSQRQAAGVQGWALSGSV